MRFPPMKWFSILTSIFVLFFVFNLMIGSADPVDSGEVQKNSHASTNGYSIHALPIPDTLYFAGERVPLEKSYVSESYDRELLVNTYWQSQTLLLIKRANRYFPIIEPILKEQGVPEDFKYLPLIESGFMERIVSPAGASGVWQFMSATAGEYGLEVNKEVDERYHLEKSTIAACEFLKKSYARFGSWTMAAASYNAGVRGMNRQIDKQQATDYYELLLNEETARYVFRILALKEILSRPADFGFHLKPEDLYPVIPTFDVIVMGSVPDFAEFAADHGATYREFKDLNPWLRETYLSNPSKKKYLMKLPTPGAYEKVKGKK